MAAAHPGRDSHRRGLAPECRAAEALGGLAPECRAAEAPGGHAAPVGICRAYAAHARRSRAFRRGTRSR
jgi:hypothetical protein